MPKMYKDLENGINKEEKGETKKAVKTATRLAECGLFVVLMVVSAYIRIPIPYVPLTFQTVVSVLAGLLLGGWFGAAAVAVYIFMGLLGLPVFANGGGGIGYVLQLSFGYLIGFIAAALVSGLVLGKNGTSFRKMVIAAFFGVLANYIVGLPYFMILWSGYYHYSNAWNALLIYNLIYFPKDLLLCFLAAVLAVRVKPLIHR